MTRILSSRRRINLMANTVSAEAVLDAMSNVAATIEDVGEEWDLETRQQVLLGLYAANLRLLHHLLYRGFFGWPPPSLKTQIF